MKRVLVVCGAGVATSTVVAKKLEEWLRERRVAARIEQCKVTEVPFRIAGVDLVVTTTNLGELKGVPVVQTVSFLTGIGLERDLDRIVELLGGAGG